MLFDFSPLGSALHCGVDAADCVVEEAYSKRMEKAAMVCSLGAKCMFRLHSMMTD